MKLQINVEIMLSYSYRVNASRSVSKDVVIFGDVILILTMSGGGFTESRLMVSCLLQNEKPILWFHILDDIHDLLIKKLSNPILLA